MPVCADDDDHGGHARGLAGRLVNHIARTCAVACAAAALLDCGGGAPPRLSGSVVLGVMASPNIAIDTVAYSITGNGIAPIEGQIDVSNPGARPGAALGGLPVGTGYLVTLAAQSTDGRTACTGSASFDVRANEQSGLTVILQCRMSNGGTGVITGTVNSCPLITSYVAPFLGITVGEAAAVSATAEDADNNPLIFAWSSSSGTFGSYSSAATTFTCATPGLATLLVTVSDGLCGDAVPVRLTCTPIACGADRDNCDGDASNGCETVLATAADHCGACGRACSPGASCANGRCTSAPPTGVVATPGGWRIALDWPPSPGATSYEVSRAMGASGTFQLARPAAINRFVDDTVASGIVYRYRVAARSAGGVSAPSNEVAATPVARQVCVTAPSTMAINVYQDTQAGLAAPVRSIFAMSSPSAPLLGIASNLLSGEIFSSLPGGAVPVFALDAAGSPTPLRVLGAPSAGTNFNLLHYERQTREVWLTDSDSNGTVMVLDALSGAIKRSLGGTATRLTHPASAVFDSAHGEVLIGQHDATSSFQEILVFGGTDVGNIAPRRTLGGPSNAAVGGWALALDPIRDEIYTSCNCNNEITVFDWAASGNTVPKRTIQIPSLLRVNALLFDAANDTLWVQGLHELPATYHLVEIPRVANGATAPVRAPIILGEPGRLARCN